VVDLVEELIDELTIGRTSALKVDEPNMKVRKAAQLNLGPFIQAQHA
jgi:hypothetical protein